MNHQHDEEPRGILDPKAIEQKFHLSRRMPGVDARFFVEHYWIVSWDLRGQEPYLSEVLSYPSVHVVVQRGQSEVYGVTTGKFTRLLCEQGLAFGIKFRPGAFYPFVKTPISRLTDRRVPLMEIFAEAGLALEQAILQVENDEDKMVATAESFIHNQLPDRDKNIILVNQIVDSIAADKSIIKVDDVTERMSLTKRSLQRLFSQYIGVSPKWVIQRFRLHEAAEKLAHGEIEDWPSLAVQLGYFDQAHFIKDFKAIVGKTPAEYARQIEK